MLAITAFVVAGSYAQYRVALNVRANTAEIHQVLEYVSAVDKDVLSLAQVAFDELNALRATEARGDSAFTEVWRVTDNAGCGSGTPVKCTLQEDGSYEVLFLTCKHVTYQSTDFLLHNMDESRHLYGAPGQVHPFLDLALIVCYSSDEITVSPIGTAAPMYGDTLTMSGYPACQGPWTSTGMASVHGKASFGVFGGCSGGPVTNSRGEVVGVVEATLGNEFFTITFASFYVTLADAKDWLIAVEILE